MFLAVAVVFIRQPFVIAVALVIAVAVLYSVGYLKLRSTDRN